MANVQIYNASAGSGKTFTLVKSFLQLILATKNVEAYKTLLAITFTNKAVNEMKERVIGQLLLFATPDSQVKQGEKKASDDAMFLQLAEQLHLTHKELQERSQKVLKHILHNYAGFTITTIDGFNQRLIRSFAFDLKLNPNFEVFLETDDLLRLAIENLFKKTNEDQLLTKLLLEFSRDKIEEDKDWDIEAELFEISKLLTNENHYAYIRELEGKQLTDFQLLKDDLKQQRKDLYTAVGAAVKDFFAFTQKEALTSAHFTRGSLYNFFEKIRNTGMAAVDKAAFTRNWFVDADNKPLYPKTLLKSEPALAQLLDEKQAWIADLLHSIEKSYWWEQFYRHLIKNVTLLAVLKSLQEEIVAIKEEENILPISEFNSIIHQTIMEEPSPFIYEKIGTRYQHYFIDEFQDTSTLQWENMLPLIADAVHSENLSKQQGSLLIVGDAKQSIYRWRGGRAEQFMELYNKEKIPFHIEQQVENLAYNFRSRRGVIDFNNDFFLFVAGHPLLFNNSGKYRYDELYRNAKQNIPDKEKEKGFVSIEFVQEKDNEVQQISEEEAIDDENVLKDEDIYIETIEGYIKEAKNNGYLDKDICILSRRNADCIEIAEKLSEKGYNVISSEALLLKNIPEIQFLIHLISISLYQNNEKEKIELLFSYTKVKHITEIHDFMSQYANKPVDTFFAAMGFSLSHFHLYSFYEGIGYAIRVFGLAKPSDAYLAQFLNVIYEYKSVRGGNIADFLAYWEEKKDKLAISAPEGVNAISIMTIHKSKGLEFPVVIYTKVNDKLRSAKDTLWIRVPKEQYHGFEHLLIDDYSGLEKIDADIVLQQSQMELLDTINTMYVAMTRPKDLLYILCDPPKGEKEDKISTLSEIVKIYLEEKGLWNEGQSRYTFGNLVPIKEQPLKAADYIPFKQRAILASSYTIVTRAGSMWNTHREDAIARGTLLHELLGQLTTQADIPQVLQQFFTEGRITEQQRPILEQQLQQLTSHPLLKDYYTGGYVVYNEREWLDVSGEYLRPDRVVYDSKEGTAVIIDYKTGDDHPQYETQLKRYAQTLEQTGWKVTQSFLVFINQQITVKKLLHKNP
jgi:uvrD/REP family helicase